MWRGNAWMRNSGADDSNGVCRVAVWRKDQIKEEYEDERKGKETEQTERDQSGRGANGAEMKQQGEEQEGNEVKRKKIQKKLRNERKEDAGNQEESEKVPEGAIRTKHPYPLRHFSCMIGEGGPGQKETKERISSKQQGQCPPNVSSSLPQVAPR